MPEVRLIDANALYAEVDESQAHNNHQGIAHSIHNSEHMHFKYMIDHAPTVEARPVRHGRWIEETEPDENGNVISMCDQCYHTDEHCKNMKIPYCWYCGADMREDMKCDESD